MKITENDIGKIIVSIVGYKRKILGVCGDIVFLSGFESELNSYRETISQKDLENYKWESEYTGKTYFR